MDSPIKAFGLDSPTGTWTLFLDMRGQLELANAERRGPLGASGRASGQSVARNEKAHS
jgi:hypothetical protein